jgi:citrate/tricarballylate utilization protein
MVVCNSCRYCEGLCAVFPAMEMRRTFNDGDLNYLANLCHSCGACYVDCQFSPPHEFEVNVPRALAIVRNDSYAAYAWPSALSVLFARNGLAISLITAVCVFAFIAGFIAYHDRQVLWSPLDGVFYKLMPHNAMALLFGAAFLYAFVAIAMGVRRFWKDIGEPASTLRRGGSLWQAFKDAGSLRYLDGGKGGCNNETDKPDDGRKLYHHATFYGFMLCFASTCVATVYHYAFGWHAPYPVYDLPVVLGTLGGVGLVIGTAGLLAAKIRRPAYLKDQSRTGMDVAFLVMLFLTAATGLALLAFRDGPAMGILLALHLGVVFSLFLTMPYGKFVHGIYRYLALVRYARESREHTPIAD